MFIAKVPASTGDKKYTIRKVGSQFVCDCHDHLYRSNGDAYLCKHLAELAAELATFATTATQSKAAKVVLGQV